MHKTDSIHKAYCFAVSCFAVLLAFNDLAVLDATGADLHALRNAVSQRLHRLKIRVPATTGDVVRVRDIVAELRPFAAKITYVCHDFTPKLDCIANSPSQIQASAGSEGVVGTSGFEPETSTVSSPNHIRP